MSTLLKAAWEHQCLGSRCRGASRACMLVPMHSTTHHASPAPLACSNMIHSEGSTPSSSCRGCCIGSACSCTLQQCRRGPDVAWCSLEQQQTDAVAGRLSSRQAFVQAGSNGQADTPRQTLKGADLLEEERWQALPWHGAQHSR